MPDDKKKTPKKRSIIMDTIFGREDDPETPEDESKKGLALVEGAKNMLGLNALKTASKTQEERKKAKEKK